MTFCEKDTEEQQRSDQEGNAFQCKNLSPRCCWFSNSFQSLPTKVGMGGVRKKTSKCTLKQESEMETETETPTKFPGEQLLLSLKNQGDWDFLSL